MEKWTISYINFFNNELLMKVINADGEINALRTALTDLGGWEEDFVPSDVNDPEDIKNLCFDCDCMVGAIKIE